MARILVTAATLAMLAGCSATEPTLGERLDADARTATRTAQAALEAERLIERGEALIERGRTRVNRGEREIGEGRALVERGEAQLRRVRNSAGS